MQLVSLISHGSIPGILGQTTFSLMTELIRYLRLHRIESGLKEKLFTCLACLRGSKLICYQRDGFWGDELLFKLAIYPNDEDSGIGPESRASFSNLALHDSSSKLLTVAAFASYLYFSPKLVISDALLVAETWICFRDTLFLCLSRKDLLDRLGSAGNLHIVICYGMTRLLCLMDKPTRESKLFVIHGVTNFFLLGAVSLLSPIMVNLYEQLKQRASEAAVYRVLMRAVSALESFLISLLNLDLCRSRRAQVVQLSIRLRHSCR